MQNKSGRNGLPPQKFRLSTAERVSDILKPDVLDDETRRQIVRDVMGVSSLVRDDRCSPDTSLLSGRHSPEGNYPAVLRKRVSGGDADCVSAMARRLKTLESQLYSYRMELKEKSDKLSLAEAKYEKEKARREEAESIVVELYDDKNELETQLLEMQKFLADYGLQWVGDGKKGNKKNGDKKKAIAGTEPEVNTQDKKNASSQSLSSVTPNSFELYGGEYINETPVLSRSPSQLHEKQEADDVVLESHFLRKSDAVSLEKGSSSFPLPVSMEVLKRHAKILSDHVGVKGVVTKGKRGGIKEREVVRIIVYKNGICVNGGIFRKFGCPLCDSVLKDIADGYYPYEFKQKYPDGFPIEIIDQTSVSAAETLNVIKSAANVKSLVSLQGEEAGGGYQTLSREDFLKRLPVSRVTPSGRIVSVKEEIAHLIGCHKNRGILRHVSGAERRTAGNESAVVAKNEDGGCSLQQPRRIKGLVAVLVRYPSGEEVALNLLPESTIAELRKELSLAVPGFSTMYDIRLSFPAVTYSDDSKTLKELGLATSCTLMVQPRTHHVKN